MNRDHHPRSAGSEPARQTGAESEKLDRVKTTALPVPKSGTPMRERDHGPIHPPASPRELPDPPRPDCTNTGNNLAPERDRASTPAGKDEAWTPRPSGARVGTDELKNPTKDDKADVASMESFPASDPPAHGGSTK